MHLVALIIGHLAVDIAVVRWAEANMLGLNDQGHNPRSVQSCLFVTGHQVKIFSDFFANKIVNHHEYFNN